MAYYIDFTKIPIANLLKTVMDHLNIRYFIVQSC